MVKWRCTSKSEYGEEGYTCQFVPVVTNGSEEQNVGGSVSIQGDGKGAVPLVSIAVRTVYDDLPVIEV